MAQKNTKKTRAAKAASGKVKTAEGRKPSDRKPVRREVWAIVCLVMSIVSLLSCFGVESFFTDLVNTLFKGLFGAGFFTLPFVFLMGFVILMFHDGRPVRLRVICTFLVVFNIGAIGHMIGCKNPPQWAFAMLKDLWLGGIAGTAGGAVAGFFAMVFSLAISKIGAMILFIITLLLEIMTCFNLTVSGIIKAIKQRPRLEYDEPKKDHPDPAKVVVEHIAQKQMEHAQRKKANISEFDIPVDDETEIAVDTVTEKPARKRTAKSPDQLILEQNAEDGILTPQHAVPVAEKTEIPEEMPAVLQEEPQKIKKEEVQKETILVAQQIEENAAEEAPAYIFPPLDLLKQGDGKSVDGTEEMRINSQRLNDALSSFNIDAHIINVVRGPSVTRYELELDRGVKLAKVTGLANDIALSLGVTDVRISAIPDKISVVGIEVPNKSVSVVLASDVIGSEAFEKTKAQLAFAVGRDIGGNCIVGDIAKMPHMLIAGTTGSGKSVCMNSLIISLLYKSTPEQVRLIMVDPKMVELQVYNSIPHLLIPVVTDPKKAAGALQWAVCEMMRRYRMMASVDVREMTLYNEVAANNKELEPMPRIVVVIDELADLMLVAAKEVEESICRIAQMGRAAGIHLVIATQRPSANVITGLMKANIPSRIAFAVASAMESRIILDTQGADKLIGKGDMLYAPLGQGKPKRIQGCFITDGEVQRVVDFVGKDATANYDNDVIAQIEKNANQNSKSGGGSSSVMAEPAETGNGEMDEMFIQAADLFFELGYAATSLLQRRLKLGFARAGRIVDEMEDMGIVGPHKGSKPRDLLITKEQWEQMKNGEQNPAVEEEIE